VILEDSAVATHHGYVMSGNLTIAAVTAYLDDCFAEWGKSPHVIARQLSASSVTRQRSTGR